MIKFLAIITIKLYQNSFSLFFPPSCRYSPTCSKYMIQSIELLGPAKGLSKGLKRILRCHPFSKHNSWDPV